MPNPFDKFDNKPNPFNGFAIPGTGPKPATGFATVGTPAALAQQTYIPGSNEDPAVKAAQAAATAGAAARASTPIEVAGQIQAASARAGIETAAKIQQLKAEQALGPKMTAEERSKAIAGYQAARLLDGQIRDIEAQFKAGPGATKGLAALSDYNPLSTVNQRFDNAGNSVRGNVGTALGFTGGQLNTPQEAAAAIGPFLPHANDRDEVVLDKIERLKALRDSARDRAAQQLGGVPDESGNIVPLDQAKKNGLWIGAQAAPPSGGGGTPLANLGVAGGATKSVDDSTINLVNGMLKQGLSAEQINGVLQASNLGSVKPEDVENARKALAAGGRAVATREAPTTLMNRLSAGPLGAFSMAAGDMASGGYLDNLTGDPAKARLGMEQTAAANPLSSFAGSMTGGVAAAAGLETGLGGLGARLGASGLANGLGSLGARTAFNTGRAISNPLAADALYGGIYGSGSSDEDRLTGGLVGAAAGAGGGMFGRGLARGIGGAARGVTNEAVQYLNGRGIPLTVGQAVGQSGPLGAAVRSAENAYSSAPILGGMVKERQRDGFRGVAQTAFDDGLAPINASTNGVIGAQGVDLAQAARSNAYNTTLDPVTLMRDAQFGMDNATSLTQAGQLPADMAQRASYAINRAGENFSPQDELTGRGLQQALRRFRRTTSENAPLPNGHDLGEVMGSAENAFTGLVQRQSPETIPALNAANAANRNVSILKDAVNRARNGTRTGETDLFAPSQLSDAAAANAGRFGNAQGTTQQPFYELTRAAQQVMPSNIGNSGTADRLSALALPAVLGGAGGGAGYGLGDTGEGAKAGLGVGALLALGGTRAGQLQLTRLLLDRPDFLRNAGQAITARSPVAGMFGAGLGASFNPYLVPSQ